MPKYHDMKVLGSPPFRVLWFILGVLELGWSGLATYYFLYAPNPVITPAGLGTDVFGIFAGVTAVGFAIVGPMSERKKEDDGPDLRSGSL